MFGIFPLLLVALVALLFGAFYAWARREGVVAPGPAGEEVAGQRRISLVTEALAYVGAILVLAGGGAAVAQRWDDLGAWGHVSVFAGTAAFFLVVGILLFARARRGRPATRRCALVPVLRRGRSGRRRRGVRGL